MKKVVSAMMASKENGVNRRGRKIIKKPTPKKKAPKKKILPKRGTRYA